MQKKSKKVTVKKNENIYFDVENVKLILLCFLFGVFGVHKFAQGKKGQGICFILLDLTIFGIFISFIWAFCNLIALTFKPGNKVGNMIVGACCLCGGLFGWPTYFDNAAKTVMVKETVITEKTKDDGVIRETIDCFAPGSSSSFVANINVDKDKLVFGLKNSGMDVLSLPIKMDFKDYSIYEGVFFKADSGFMPLEFSTNSQDYITVKMPKQENRQIQIAGKILDVYREYQCKKI